MRARIAAGALALLAASGALAQTSEQQVTEQQVPARIVSLNMCTDQLALDLLPPDRIAGLSPYARNALRDGAGPRSSPLPLLSGTAEEVMVLMPDLVVTNRFTRRATQDFIRIRGIPIEEFDIVRTVAEAREQILRFGAITGTGGLAAERVGAIDAALAGLRKVAARRPLRVLPLSRRGWVEGPRSLTGDLLAQAGFVNPAGELGLAGGGFATLEAIVALRPDAILIARSESRAEDQGQAMLLHPAIQDLFPPERRIVLPDRLVVCGGPMLADAMRLLAQQLERLEAR